MLLGLKIILRIVILLNPSIPMNLADALQVIREAEASPADEPTISFDLICGFTPLHLEQLLKAHLYSRQQNGSISLRPGTFGDVIGSLSDLDGEAELAFIVVAWEDLDPRLGLRQADWRPGLAEDILETVGWRLRQLQEVIEKQAPRLPLLLSMPPPRALRLTSTPPHQMGYLEAQLQALCAQVSAKLSLISGLRIINIPDAVAPAERYDLRADFRFGIPYSIAYLDALSEAFARLAVPLNLPLKGLITDLDDTVWRGLVGEVGAESVSWSLEKRSHAHALYQQQLRALEQSGILLAIASKNEIGVALRGLNRDDCLVTPEMFNPQEIHWEPKSESVSRILRAWNISADAVVFVDDSLSELEEVRRIHPSIHTRQFLTRDDAGVMDLLSELQDLFGKSRILETDRLRAASLRREAPPDRDATGDREAFLAAAQGKLKIECTKEPDDRAFELINKTNQFNLNGHRLSEKAWMSFLKAPETRILKASYEDKFGSLGKIAVLAGHFDGNRFTVDHWVLSCRAFSRRIEHAMLASLFAILDTEKLHFEYLPTERNQPITRFLQEILRDKAGHLSMLSREAFDHTHQAHFLSVILDHETS
jgi:FkbH-like protein